MTGRHDAARRLRARSCGERLADFCQAGGQQPTADSARAVRPADRRRGRGTQERWLAAASGRDASVTSSLTNLLNATWNASTELRRPLIQQLLKRFKTTRTLWPNPWALRLLDHPGTQH